MNKKYNNRNAINSINIQKPQFQEVFNYFVQKEFEIAQAQKFYNYYESKGWRIEGESPCKDWQIAIENWMNKA